MKKNTTFRPALLCSIVSAIVWFLGAPPICADTITWSIDGSGTWNDTTTGNWTPAQVPVNGDRVVINRANGATVDFASANFSGTNRLLAPSDWQPALVLGGSGGTNILQIGSGDTLQVDAPAGNYVGIQVNNGGQLNISGGMVTSLGTVAFSNALVVNNGGGVTVSGTGLLQFNSRDEIFVADTAGHSASLTVSGSGQLTYPNTTGNSGGDFHARAGNSTVSVSDSGLLRVGRDLNVGTTGGTHVWTLSGGTLERAGARDYRWDLGNNNGNGSVTFTQTGGRFLNSGHETYLRKTAQYAISGDPTSVSMVNGTLYVDGTLNQSGGYVNNAYELYVGNTSGATGVYTATAGSLRTRGLHIGAAVGATGTLTLNAGVVYTNSINGTSPERIVIGATSGVGTGTLEVKGLSGISGSGFSHVYLNQTGVLRGYGTLSGTGGSFQMNGKVIADGYGSDQTLNLSGRGGLTNTVNNTTGKGWYAVNGGKLTLPTIAVATGNNNYNWGEPVADASIDLINSLRMEFTNVGTAGPLAISLLAADRTDLPAPPAVLQGGPVIGVWDIVDSGSFAFGSGSAKLTFRYDSSLYTYGGTHALQLFHYVGGNWVDVTSGYDSQYIWVDSVNSFSLFAVGYIPEPGSLSLLALAGLAVLRRRR